MATEALKASACAEAAGTASFWLGDSLSLYGNWEPPACIVSDGPYGVRGYRGDLDGAEGLAEWYRPHVEAWSRLCLPCCTLWFWNTEQGWAEVHPVLKECGWQYVSCCIWDKGMGHAAGNVNTQTIGHLPVVTEVCVQYVRRPTVNGVPVKEWLRSEWKRTGLPLSEANRACGVANAASRKWLGSDSKWYMPLPDDFAKLAEYAERHGRADGRPYFSADGKRPMNAAEWQALRPKFHCPVGRTNVWNEPHLSGGERLKDGKKAVHLNQKPLKLMKDIVAMSTDEGDAVWEPFGGLFTASIACLSLNRRSFAAEIDPETHSAASRRIREFFLMEG